MKKKVKEGGAAKKGKKTAEGNLEKPI